jgi:tetratricopeptide (TPR) repeat protein
VTVIAFHPDDLLDRELRGLLSDDERGRLDAHLAGCAVCRLERSLRADFAEEAAVMVAPKGLSSFVTAALQEAQAQDGNAPPLVAQALLPASAGRGRVSRRYAGALLVAAVLGMSAVAFARTGWVEATMRVAEEQVAAVLGKAKPKKRVQRPRSSDKPPTTVAPGPSAIARPASLETSASSLLAPAPLPVTLGAAGRAPTGTRKPRALARALAVQAAQGVSADSAPASSVVPDAPAAKAVAAPLSVEAPVASAEIRSVPAGPSAAELLFEQATRQRRAGHVDAAVATYRTLIAEYGASPEARRCQALLGRLLLDTARMAPALDAFDTYLGSRDVALREDALAGRARALAALGRESQAHRAYAELLREYPRTSYAAWARTRHPGE